MNIQQSKLEQCLDAGNTTLYRLNGAEYHLERLRRAYKEVVSSWSYESQEIVGWEAYAMFVELMSAFECLLWQINVGYDLGISQEEINWNRSSNAVKNQCKADCFTEWLRKGYGEEWFKRLRCYRNRICHRGGIERPEGILIGEEISLRESVRVEKRDGRGRLLSVNEVRDNDRPKKQSRDDIELILGFAEEDGEIDEICARYYERMRKFVGEAMNRLYGRLHDESRATTK